MKGNTVRLFAFLIAVAEATVGVNAGPIQSRLPRLPQLPRLPRPTRPTPQPPQPQPPRPRPPRPQRPPRLVLPLMWKMEPSGLVPHLWTLSVDGQEYIPARVGKDAGEEVVFLGLPFDPSTEQIRIELGNRLHLYLVDSVEQCVSGVVTLASGSRFIHAHGPYRPKHGQHGQHGPTHGSYRPTRPTHGPTLKDVLESIESIASTIYDADSAEQWLQKQFQKWLHRQQWLDTEQFEKQFQAEWVHRQPIHRLHRRHNNNNNTIDTQSIHKSTCWSGDKWMAVGLSSLVIFSVTLALLVFWKLENRRKSSRKRKAFLADSLCSATN